LRRHRFTFTEIDLLNCTAHGRVADASRQPRLRRHHLRFGDAQRRNRRIQIGLRPGSGLAQRERAVIALLSVGERRLVLVEIGLLQIIVDRVKLFAGLDLISSRMLSLVTRPDSSGLTKIMSASTQP
jgi:hypothetical protein